MNLVAGEWGVGGGGGDVPVVPAGMRCRLPFFRGAVVGTVIFEGPLGRFAGLAG